MSPEASPRGFEKKTLCFSRPHRCDTNIPFIMCQLHETRTTVHCPPLLGAGIFLCNTAIFDE